MRLLFVGIISAAVTSIVTYTATYTAEVIKKEKANEEQFTLFTEAEKLTKNYKIQAGRYPDSLSDVFPKTTNMISLNSIFYKKTSDGYLLIAKLPFSGWMSSDSNKAEQDAAANP